MMPQSCVDVASVDQPAPGLSSGPGHEPSGSRLSRELNRPLERLLKVVAQISGARAAVIRRRQFDNDSMPLMAAIGIVAAPISNPDCAPDSSPGPQPAALRAGASRAADEAGFRSAGEAPGSARDRHVMSIPLSYRDRSCGVLSLILDGPAAEPELSPELRELLAALGAVLGTAIESARRADLNVYTSVMQERQFLANEVHDSLAQNLTSIRMRTSLLRDAVRLQRTERVASHLEQIDESLAVVQLRAREIITQFRAQMDAPHLVPALEYAIDELRTASGVQIELVDRLQEPKLSPYEEVQVFYIAREALTNALKHAKAGWVRLLLGQAAGRIEVVVEDDGVGMDSDRGDGDGHFGLHIMRERAQRLGGRIEFERRTPVGTRVRLSFAATATPGEGAP